MIYFKKNKYNKLISLIKKKKRDKQISIQKFYFMLIHYNIGNKWNEWLYILNLVTIHKYNAKDIK